MVYLKEIFYFVFRGFFRSKIARKVFGKELRDLTGDQYKLVCAARLDNEGNVDLSGFSFVGLDIGEANLSKANLSSVDGRGVDFSRINLRFAVLCYANLKGAYFVLKQARINSVDTYPWAKTIGMCLEGVDFSYANLAETNFENAFLWKAKLVEAHLLNANLVGAVFTRANMHHACFVRADLSRARLIDVEASDTKWQDACLLDAELTGAYLPRADFRNANLTGADITKANIHRALFGNASLFNLKVAEGYVCTGEYYHIPNVGREKGVLELYNCGEFC